jgi:hypothetical protein
MKHWKKIALFLIGAGATYAAVTWLDTMGSFPDVNRKQRR